MDLAGALIDGEAVAFTADGRTDFSALQKALSEGGPIDFFAFDMLEEGGEDIDRAAAYRAQAAAAGALRRPARRTASSISARTSTATASKVLTEICAAGHEGIVSKKATAPYRSERTKSWLKIKCSRRQEFVIGGWTPPTSAAASARCCSAPGRTASSSTMAASAPASTTATSRS